MNDPLLINITKQFTVERDTFASIVHGFKAECEKGLTGASSSIMIPSFVTRLPTGAETGTFLSLDLGGSNLRVSAVELQGHNQVLVSEVKRPITDTQRTTSVDEFFDWIADAVHELLNMRNMNKQRSTLAMGVCWSFPLDQTDIKSGKILRMGKGFVLDGVDGQDLATLFHQAFKRNDLNIKVAAVLNDTVGTLVAHAYTNPGAAIGYIYGTGVNAAYAEKKSRISKLDKSKDNGDIMLINTEIDLFGDDSYLPRTCFDRILDDSHSQPGYQLYEKMTSGAYLGELTRLIAVEVISSSKGDDCLFDGNVPSKLVKPWEFTTSMMGYIESMDDQDDDASLASSLGTLGEYLGCVHNPRVQDIHQFASICRIVSSRAAILAAASMAAIIEQQANLLSSQEPIIIGVNGSTFEKYPHMKKRIHRALCSWFGEATGARIQIDVARDGGSVGGALIAMLYSTRHRHDNITSWLCIPSWNVKQKYRKKIKKLVSKLSSSSSSNREKSPAVSSNEKKVS